MDKYTEYKTIIEELGSSKYLSLCGKNIDDIEVKYLAEALKNTQITSLDLRNNIIGCNGLKYLMDVLKDTEITGLYLNDNLFGEDAKYLAESLKNTKIVGLDLRKNRIGTVGAQHLFEVFRNIKLNSFYIDVYYTEDRDIDKYIECHFHNMNQVDITINNNKIGINGAQFIQNTFKNFKISELTFAKEHLDDEFAEYFALAFKNLQIRQLILGSEIHQIKNVEYLIRAFKESYIGILYVRGKMRDWGAKNLAEFLKHVQVFELDICKEYIRDAGLKYLAPALRNSDIMCLNMPWNDIRADGMKYLAEILPYSKIIHIDLCHNYIQTEGARHLANSLPFSQVTGIHLHGNWIQLAGYWHLMDVIDQTNLKWANLHDNGFPGGSLPRYSKSIAEKIRSAFQSLISLNPLSNEYEFIIPSKKNAQYAFLFKTLKENPISKIHIFDIMREREGFFDVDSMKRINDFIEIMPKKFITFIENKLPELVEAIPDYNFVDLVRELENMKFYDIVEHLLLHRELYFVDENQEFLHPYIYKTLHKYNLPLYNEQLEPNKKQEIISYFQSHQEIDGVQEITDLFRSMSFE